MKFKITIGAFGKDDAADIKIDGRAVGWLERVRDERFASVTRSFVARYSLMLTDADADAQLHRRAFKRAGNQHADQQTPAMPVSTQRGKMMPSQNATMIAYREWISLGVLALEAAERAHEANDELAENYYLTLARKCDASADQCAVMADTVKEFERPAAQAEKSS